MPTPPTLTAFAKALDVEVDDLLDSTEFHSPAVAS
jgi:hypothetical protein